MYMEYLKLQPCVSTLWCNFFFKAISCPDSSFDKLQIFRKLVTSVSLSHYYDVDKIFHEYFSYQSLSIGLQYIVRLSDLHRNVCKHRSCVVFFLQKAQSFSVGYDFSFV